MRARAFPLAFAIIHSFFMVNCLFFFTTALPLRIFPRVSWLGGLPATQRKRCVMCNYHRRNRIAGKAAGGLASLAISSVPAMEVGYRKTTLLYY
uniref:Putative secreted protein n=1 Tax=Ixodes ricinus TaxID=34613 RepID=A0A147BQJ6_IXORI